MQNYKLNANLSRSFLSKCHFITHYSTITSLRFQFSAWHRGNENWRALTKCASVEIVELSELSELCIVSNCHTIKVNIMRREKKKHRLLYIHFYNVTQRVENHTTKWKKKEKTI